MFLNQELYRQSLQHAGTFARSRLDLGVHVPGRCRVAELELKPPTREELSDLVQGRMAAQRTQMPGGDHPRSFRSRQNSWMNWEH